MICVEKTICYDNSTLIDYNYYNKSCSFNEYYKLLIKHNGKGLDKYNNQIFFSFSSLFTGSLYSEWDSLFFIVEGCDSKGIICRVIRPDIILTNYFAHYWLHNTFSIPVGEFKLPQNYKTGRKFYLSSIAVDYTTGKFFVSRGEIYPYNSNTHYLGKCSQWLAGIKQKQAGLELRAKNRVTIQDKQTSVDTILAKNKVLGVPSNHSVNLVKGMVFYNIERPERRHWVNINYGLNDVHFKIVVGELKSHILLCKIPPKISSFDISSRKVPKHWGSIATDEPLNLARYLKLYGAFPKDLVKMCGEGSYDIKGDTLYVEPDISVIDDDYLKKYCIKVLKSKFDTDKINCIFFKEYKYSDSYILWDGKPLKLETFVYYDDYLD